MTPNPYGWWLPLNASAHAQGVDRVLGYVHAFMLVLFVFWGTYFVYCLVRFREKSNRSANLKPREFKFPIYAEVLVFLVEIFLLVFVSSPLWLKLKTQLPPETEALRIRVVAEQFAWNIHYPGPDGVFGRTAVEKMDGTNPIGLDRDDPAAKDDVVSTNVLHIPVNKKVIAILSSKDVIHNFFLPVLRVKQDILPGMATSVWFEASIPGQFEIACAQLCGLGHYRMKGQLWIDTPEQYEAWMNEELKALQPGGQS